jgi:hypothetical protein
VPNKLTALAREGLTHVYHALGGHEAFEAWAREHSSQFYALFVKIAPKEREANAIGTGVQIFIQSAADMGPTIEERRAMEERRVIDVAATERSDDDREATGARRLVT